MKNLVHKICIFTIAVALLACAGNNAPTGVSGGGLDDGGSQVGVGGGTPLDSGVLVSNAAPEQDAGVLGPEADPEKVVAKIICGNAKCIVTKGIYTLDGYQEPDTSSSCVHFKIYLGYQLNDWTPCCNGRVLRLVELNTKQSLDLQTNLLDGMMGGVEVALGGDGPIKVRVFLAPEGYIAPLLDEWASCGSDCIPEGWQEFLNPWHDPSCGFMKFMTGPTFQYQKDVMEHNLVPSS